MNNQELPEAERFEDWFARINPDPKPTITLESTAEVAVAFPVEEGVESFDYASMADDIPTHEQWFRFRVWDDELTGRSYTG